MSCVTNGLPNQWVGQTFKGSAYYRFEIDISPRHLQPGNNCWPAGWMFPVEFFAAADPTPGITTMSEVDVFEDINYLYGTLHRWTTSAAGHTDTQAQYRENSDSVPVTVGALIVAPEDNEGTGYIERYINDVAQPNIVTWTPGSTYSRTSLDHHCIMLQSGLNQSLVVRSVQVWTASPAGGGTDGRGLLKRR